MHNRKSFIYVIKDYYLLDIEYQAANSGLSGRIGSHCICRGDENGGIAVFYIDFGDGSVFSVVAESRADLFSGRYLWSPEDPGKVFPMLFHLLNMYPELVMREAVNDIKVVPYGSEAY